MDAPIFLMIFLFGNIFFYITIITGTFKSRCSWYEQAIEFHKDTFTGFGCIYLLKGTI